MSQVLMVLEYLRVHPQGLTQGEAYEVLPERITNLSGRISELDKAGYDIYRARVVTLNGHHCVSYVLRGEPEDKPEPVPAPAVTVNEQGQAEMFEADQKQEAI